MHKFLIAFVGAGALALTGCQSAPEKKAEAPAKPMISAEAANALTTASKDIKAAEEAGALWTPAEDALKNAKKAADKGDSATVIKDSKKASELTAISMEQLKYPSTEKY
jgi:flagellar basal body L-ring protein FlgH